MCLSVFNVEGTQKEESTNSFSSLFYDETNELTYYLRQIQCIYQEITIPSMERIRKEGHIQFIWNFISEILVNFAMETNLFVFPNEDKYRKENLNLKFRYEACLKGKQTDILSKMPESAEARQFFDSSLRSPSWQSWF